MCFDTIGFDLIWGCRASCIAIFIGNDHMSNQFKAMTRVVMDISKNVTKEVKCDVVTMRIVLHYCLVLHFCFVLSYNTMHDTIN